MYETTLTFLGFMIVAMVTIIVLMTAPIHIGCHVVGTEINGDYSTEYLQIGDCG